MRRDLLPYFDFRDWWVGYYRGPDHHYVCLLPTLVLRWDRKAPSLHADTPSGSGSDDALAIVREWVEKAVDDYRDPVIDPELHDALRIVVGLPPYSRDD